MRIGKVWGKAKWDVDMEKAMKAMVHITLRCIVISMTLMTPVCLVGENDSRYRKFR